MANNPKNVKIIQVSKQSLPPQVAHGRWQSTGPDVPDNFVVLPLVASTPLIGCGLVHPTRWCPNTKVCLTSWNLWFTAVTIVRWGNVNQDLTGPNLAARASWCHHESVDCCTVEWSRMCVDIYILCVCVRYGWWFCPHPPKSITFVRGSPSQIWLNNVNSPATNQILYIISYIYIYCETSILAPSARKHEWKMQPVAAQRTLCRRQNAYTMGPKLVPQIWKLGYILILVLWNPFWGPESGPCFGATKHKQEQVNTGSKCATADASWQQHIPVILYVYIYRERDIH